MNTTTLTRTKLITAAVGAAIAGVAAPALLFLGAGTAQAVQDVSERGGIAIIADLPTPRDCAQCGGFNPQPDPPGNPDPDTEIGIGNPNDFGADKTGVGNPNERPSQILDPASKAGLGGPDTKGGVIDPGEKGFIIYG